MANSHCMSVITGDVIASRKSGPAVWMPALKSVLSMLGSSPEDWDIYRGDAFQFLVRDPCDALKVAMLIKSGFKAHKGLDVRMAIGVGAVDFRAPTVGQSSGEAFVLSGALADKLESLYSTLMIASTWPEFDEDANASMSMAAALMDKWLPNYAQAMFAYLAEPTATQIALAEKLGIAQNTLSERQSKAYRRELVGFERAFRLKLARLIEAHYPN